MRADDPCVAAAKQGDSTAWGELYLAHAGMLALWLEATTDGDRATRQQLLAEAWLIAAERVADYRGDSAHFGLWLITIASSRRRRAWKRSLRRVARAGLAAHAPLPAPVVQGDDLIDPEVLRPFAVLPPRRREVMVCLQVLGLDVRSAASALGISPAAVRRARLRARRSFPATSTSGQ